MKYLKITTRQTPGMEGIRYPTNYQNEIGDFAVDHLYYEVGGVLRLLLLVPDKYYTPSMIREYVEEITEQEAIGISVANEKILEKITDEAKIRRIEIKTRLNQVLTADELKAIDPGDPTPGIEKEERLADRIPEKKKHEILNMR